MSFVTKRKSGKSTYYYVAHSVKINGVSNQKILKSLGSADNILATFNAAEQSSEPPDPENYIDYQFGLVAALLNIADRLGAAEIIDKILPKRSQGLSIGEYMVLAAINLLPSQPARIHFSNGSMTPFCLLHFRLQTTKIYPARASGAI